MSRGINGAVIEQAHRTSVCVGAAAGLSEGDEPGIFLNIDVSRHGSLYRRNRPILAVDFVNLSWPTLII